MVISVLIEEAPNDVVAMTGSICTSGGHQLQGTVSATIPIGQ